MSFDDLLGDGPAIERPRGRGRQLGSTNKPKPESAADRNDLHLKVETLHNVTSGVSITWLSKVFRMPRYKIEAALRECPVLRTAQGGTQLYDVSTAAKYLVEPTTNLDAFLQTIDAKKLPERLRESFWNAKIKEAKYRTMAGELWPSEAVLEVLCETFKTIKKTTQLWVDTIDETTGLTDAQRSALVLLVDRLQDDMHKSLVLQADGNVTESFLKDLDNDEAEAT
jgi:hypothetical protein